MMEVPGANTEWKSGNTPHTHTSRNTPQKDWPLEGDHLRGNASPRLHLPSSTSFWGKTMHIEIFVAPIKGIIHPQNDYESLTFKLLKKSRALRWTKTTRQWEMYGFPTLKLFRNIQTLIHIFCSLNQVSFIFSYWCFHTFKLLLNHFLLLQCINNSPSCLTLRFNIPLSILVLHYKILDEQEYMMLKNG